MRRERVRIGDGEGGFVCRAVALRACTTCMYPANCMQVRLASMAENAFNAVERVDEFSHIPSEGNENLSVVEPPERNSTGTEVSTNAGA